MASCKGDEKNADGGCCVPSAGREDVATAAPGVAHHEPQERMMARMIELPGGTFLMGTDTVEGFPQDGEGPVRAVTLDAFAIDRTPVTNQVFAQFVAATGYKTEAERFGWSFVFWSHIPKDRFKELVQDTVAAAPWWCKVEGARWDQPEGPGSDVARRSDHPVVHVSWNDAAAFCVCGARRPGAKAVSVG